MASAMRALQEMGQYVEQLEAERDRLRSELEEADAALRGTVTGMQGAIDEIKAERDKLVAGLQAEVKRLRDWENKFFDRSERAPLGSAEGRAHELSGRGCAEQADRLQALLDESKGGDDGE